VGSGMRHGQNPSLPSSCLSAVAVATPRSKAPGTRNHTGWEGAIGRRRRGFKQGEEPRVAAEDSLCSSALLRSGQVVSRPAGRRRPAAGLVDPHPFLSPASPPSPGPAGGDPDALCPSAG
jgi:hypothetical protein